MFEYDDFVEQLEKYPGYTSTPTLKREREELLSKEPDIINVEDDETLVEIPTQFPHENLPFIFYEIWEILRFLEDGFPYNNRIKTVGKFAFVNGVPRLKARFRSVKLNLSAVKTWPKVDRKTLEVSGICIMEEEMPIIVVYEFLELKTNFAEYVDKKRQAQKLFPDLRSKLMPQTITESEEEN